MTIEEIRSNIRYNENLIAQYSQEKRDLENQISELEALSAKYSGLQSRFGDRQQQRQNRLSFFLSSCLAEANPSGPVNSVKRSSKLCFIVVVHLILNYLK